MNKIILILLAATLFACKNSPKETKEDNKTNKAANTISSNTKNSKSEQNITVSILPQKFMAEQICGDFCNINVLIPPGANPATSEITNRQITALINSQLYFSIGHLPYEITHVSKILKKHPEITHINLSENIDLIRGKEKHGDHFHEGGIDPHIWTSYQNAKIMCRDIFNALTNKFPEQKKIFEHNYGKLINRIDSLAAITHNSLKNLKNKNFIIYHPALTYFARENGLNQIAVEYEGKSPSPLHIRKIISAAKESGTRIVLVQKQFDVTKADFIAKEINGKVVEINPLGEDWESEMMHLTKIFSENLR